MEGEGDIVTDSDVTSDSTGYSSDEDREHQHFSSLTSPMIVVSNRLPFVLKRTEDGALMRQSR